MRRPRTEKRRLPRALIALTAAALVLASVPASGSVSEPKPIRLDTRLARLASDVQPIGEAAPGTIPRVDVQIFPQAGNDPAFAASLGALGATDLVWIGPMLSASVPVSALAALGADTRIDWVRTAPIPVPESVTGQEVADTDADDWHAAAITGGGVKIAVIDLSFAGYTTRQAEGDLPDRLHVFNQCDGGFTSGSDHGTAVAEVVHEMAPDATLYLACIDDDGDLSVATDWAIAQGVDVIVHSVGWFPPGRGDGSGWMQPILTAARDAGILWVNSAGNYAEQHWLGTFTDVDTDQIHEFGPADENLSFNLFSGFTVSIYLRWDDWPVSSLDYDLFLYGGPSDPACLPTVAAACSTNAQSGTQPPTEEIVYTNPTFSTQNLTLEIVKTAGAGTPTMDMFMLGTVGGSIEYPVATSSINDPGSSPLVAAIGAIDLTGEIRSYSSRGPTIGGTTKPDLVVPDGVANASISPFFGTSAAAPGAGGGAALLYQAASCPDAAALHADLVAHAEDIEPAGPDDDYGAGRLRLGTPPDPGDPVVRYWGANRFETAVAISAADLACGAKTVFLAVGHDYPDALSGAAAAGRNGAPLLLVDTDSIPAATAAELTRLDPDTLVILGGTAVISDSVATELATYGSVVRLAGADRYETSATISQWAFPGGSDIALVATGSGFADALAGAPAAVHAGGPLLLTDPGALPAAIAAELARLSPSAILVLGGPAAVSDSVVAELNAIAPTTRLAGANRYATAAAIAQSVFPTGSSRVYVAVGDNFPDALAGGAAAGFYDAPVLLVRSDTLPAEAATEVARLGAQKALVLGGTAVLSDLVVAALTDILD